MSKTKTITLRVPEEFHDKVSELAFEERRSVNQMYVWLVIKGLEVINKNDDH